MNKYTSKEKISSYRRAVEQLAGGKFFTGDLEKMSSNIINEIRDTKNSLLKTSKKTFITDHPEIFFISLVILYAMLIFIEKRIKT